MIYLGSATLNPDMIAAWSVASVATDRGIAIRTFEDVMRCTWACQDQQRLSYVHHYVNASPRVSFKVRGGYVRSFAFHSRLVQLYYAIMSTQPKLSGNMRMRVRIYRRCWYDEMRFVLDIRGR